MGKAKSAAKAAPVSADLEALLEGVNPQRATQERKFQAILDCYNARDEDKEKALSGVKFYIFRTFPRIDNRLSGRQYSNLETFECVKASSSSGDMVEVSELPEDIRAYVTTRHGGGRYRVSLNDKGRDAEQVAQTALKIDEIEFPPILDPKELITTDPETMGWITRQVSTGALVKLQDGGYAMVNDRSRGPAATAARGDEPSGGISAVAIEAMRLASGNNSVQDHAYKSAIDMVKETATSMAKPTSDPAQLLIAMASALKGNDGGMVAMCTLMSTMMVEQNKMMMFMMGQKNPQPRDRESGDTVDQVERVMEMVGKYGGPKPAGGITEMLKEWAPMLLPLLPLFMAGRMPPGQAPAIAQALAGMANTAAAPSTDSPASMGGPAPGGQLSMQQAQEFAARAMAAMQRNHSGDDFALGLEVIFNPQTYDMVRQLGRDNIIGFLLQSQHGQYFAANGPNTTKFVEEFLSYGDAPSETPDVPGAATAAATAAPATV